MFPHLQWSPAAVDSAAAGGSLRPTSSSSSSEASDRCVIGRSNLFPPPCSCAGSCACAAMYSPPSGRPLWVHVWDELTHVHCEALLVRSRASSWRCKACCHVWAARRSQRQVLAEHTARQRTRSVPCLRRAACVPKRCRRARRRVLTALSVILSVWHAHIFFRKMAISGVYCRHRKRRAARAHYKALSPARTAAARRAPKILVCRITCWS